MCISAAPPFNAPRALPMVEGCGACTHFWPIPNRFDFVFFHFFLGLLAVPCFYLDANWYIYIYYVRVIMQGQAVFKYEQTVISSRNNMK
jgi:hypothetical protein